MKLDKKKYSFKTIFTQNLIKKGNRFKALKLNQKLTKELFLLKQTKKINNSNIFEKAILSNKTLLKLLKKRFGSKTYFIPILIQNNNDSNIAIKNLINSAKNRSEKKIVSKLINEIIETNSNKSASVKKKKEFNNKVIENMPYLRYLK